MAARLVARLFGYDQVLIVGRRVGNDPDPHGEHVTSFGTTNANKFAAAALSYSAQEKLLGWKQTKGSE